MLSDLRSKWQDVLVKRIESEMMAYQKQINKLTSNKAQFNSMPVSFIMIISDLVFFYLRCYFTEKHSKAFAVSFIAEA